MNEFLEDLKKDLSRISIIFGSLAIGLGIIFQFIKISKNGFMRTFDYVQVLNDGVFLLGFFILFAGLLFVIWMIYTEFICNIPKIGNYINKKVMFIIRKLGISKKIWILCGPLLFVIICMLFFWVIKNSMYYYFVYNDISYMTYYSNTKYLYAYEFDENDCNLFQPTQSKTDIDKAGWNLEKRYIKEKKNAKLLRSDLVDEFTLVPIICELNSK